MDPNQTAPVPASTKQQVVDTLRNATNVLVTVSANPSVDQLAACIGLTLMLNKLDKHATAVFSGQIPSTIEFLQPEKTLEQNTDSLRDFIISLDRAKADKLRYKIEDNVVKIFITPYRTSLGQSDLQFSQGDFNVDVVVALGVDKREHLDQAITAHGRILHDAAVISLSSGQLQSDVGSINWHEAQASSLCEMLVSISEAFQSGLLDGQMATAFLTGIVSETARFSNAKTTPKVMTMSAQLMAAGANQQLISTKLTPPPSFEKPIAIKDKPVKEMDIPHGEEKVEQAESAPVSLQEPEPEEQPTNLTSPAPAVEPELPNLPDDELERIHIDEAGKIHDASVTAELDGDLPKAAPSQSNIPLLKGKERVIQPLPPEPESPAAPTAPVPKPTAQSNYIFEEPKNGGTFTAATSDDAREETPAPGFAPASETPLLSHEPPTPPVPPAPSAATAAPEANEDAARQAVVDAVSSIDYKPLAAAPIEALNAQPVDLGPPVNGTPINPNTMAPPVVPPPLPPMPPANGKNGNEPPELTLPTPGSQQ